MLKKQLEFLLNNAENITNIRAQYDGFDGHPVILIDIDDWDTLKESNIEEDCGCVIIE